MATKKTATPQKTSTTHPGPGAPAVDERFEEFADPLQLIDQMEEAKSDADDPYWQWADQLLAAVLASDDADTINDAQHLKETSGGFALVRAARHAGFVIGFEYAARLLRSCRHTAFPAEEK
ncbi:hypothetical protein BH18ACI5_BH18ACI5_04490 [soil metagenome]